MSDVLQLSDAPGWTTVDSKADADRAATPTIAPTLQRDHDADAGKDAAPTVAVTERMGRAHSEATPYHQYLTALVQRIFLMPDRLSGPIRSVVFSGVDTREDAALLPAAAAELLATRVSGRICLVDADFLTPSLHYCYGIANTIGLFDALSGTGPVRSYARRLIQGHDSSLWLLPTGASHDHANQLLASEAAATRIRDLIEAFDYLVVFAPPVTRHTAARILGAQVDGIVLIADAQVTRRRHVRTSAEMLRTAGGRLLGTVLNNRSFPIPDAIYRFL